MKTVDLADAKAIATGMGMVILHNNPNEWKNYKIQLRKDMKNLLKFFAKQ